MVSNASATGYINQRKLDRCQNGNLVSFFSDTGTNGTFRVSTDGGITWANPAIDIAGVVNGSMFIDLDDYIHVAWKQSGTGGTRTDGFIYYMRGMPNAGRTSWTWSAATLISSTTGIGYPDIVAHREGTGWKAHIVLSFTSTAPANTTQYAIVDITSGGVVTATSAINLSPAFPGYSVNLDTYPSIDFNHTGDGKTVAGSTPHLYVAWSAGKTGAGFGIRFKKATYAAGIWTWGTEREIDNTAFVSLTNTDWINCLFDGTRVMIGLQGRDASNNLIRLLERDAADTTTISYASEIVSSGVGWLATGAMTYDASGNLYLFGVESFFRDFVYRKFTRTSGTLGTSVIIGSATQSSTPYFSVKRGYSNQRIEWIYTSGNNSPYAVKYDQISLTATGSASASFSGTASVAGTKTQFGNDTATIQSSIAVHDTQFGKATANVISGASVTGLLIQGGQASITIKSRLSANWKAVSPWNPSVPALSGIWQPLSLQETTWDR